MRRIIGDSYYRVGDHLWNQAEKEAERTKILDQYIRRGLEAKGRYEEPKILIKKIEKYWDQYKEYGLEEPKLSPNRKIMNVILGNFI